MRNYKFGIAMGMLLAVLLNLAGPKLYAQLQQSGGPGSTVTIGAAIPAGANVIGKTSIDQTTPGTTNLVSIGSNGTVGITGTLPAFTAIPAFKIDQTTPGTTNAVQLTGALPTLAAGTNTIGVTIPKTPCGTTVFNQDLAAVPTSTGSPTSTTTCLMRAYFNNTTASPVTVTLTDNTGTPLNVVGPAFSVPGLSNMVIPYDGIRFNAGVKWIAGGAGVVGGMWGFQ